MFIGCSSNKELDTTSYKNVFDDKNVFPLANKVERSNSKLDKVKNLKNVFNAKSYNTTHPSLDYPLEKIWEINTDQNIIKTKRTDNKKSLILLKK